MFEWGRCEALSIQLVDCLDISNAAGAMTDRTGFQARTSVPGEVTAILLHMNLGRMNAAGKIALVVGYVTG